MLKQMVLYTTIGGLLVTMVLIVVMALTSPFNRHPDEQLHYASAAYYFTHWLPPAVDDPYLKKVYKQTPWGVSYLNTLDICYFGAAKFAVLSSFLGAKSYLGLRFFQVFILLVLLLLGLLYSNRLSIALLLITPQVWYVFSYMNGDAFPFFLSMALCIWLASPGNGFIAYLQKGGRKFFLYYGLPVAIAAGLLILSKKNYYIFLLFVLFYILSSIFEMTPVIRRRTWGRFALVCLVAFSIFFIRFGYDVYINGLNKRDKIIAAAEKYADDRFKPSKAGTNLSYDRLRLKKKGVSYLSLFTNYHWHRDSLYSFFGVYGYMEFYAKEKYYRYAWRLSIILLGIMAWVFLFRQDRAERIFTLGTLAFFFGTIFISTWHSWVYAFQPQGRYLFPIIPMLGIWLEKNRRYLSVYLLWCLLGAFFILSLNSFFKVGLANLL